MYLNGSLILMSKDKHCGKKAAQDLLDQKLLT